MRLLPGPIVSASWLADHLDEVAVADVRWYLDGRSGRAAYDAGHLPGAVFVDLDRDLSGPTGPGTGRHPLPTPEALADALGRLGLGEDKPVVAYDDASGSIAARLWWMLRAVGQDAAVLDGGLPAWTGRLDTVPPTLPPRPRRPVAWPLEQVVDTDEVDRLRSDPTVLILDARAADRYEGRSRGVDARPGHIPGARSAPWTANVGHDGRLLDSDALRTRYEQFGKVTRVVASCGSGVTACHDLLALTIAGVGPVALYPGSWSAWTDDPGRPAALGPDPS